jgi:hypothetical protein
MVNSIGLSTLVSDSTYKFFITFLPVRQAGV